MSDSEDITVIERFIDGLHEKVMDRTYMSQNLINMDTGSETSELESESDIGQDPWQYQKSKRKRVNSQQHDSYSSVLQDTVKRAPVKRLINSPKQPKKYVLIVSNRDEKLGLKNPIQIQKLMSSSVGIVKELGATRTGHLMVVCFDKHQFNQLSKLTHLGQWSVNVFQPKSLNTTIGCIYNVSLDIEESDLQDILEKQQVSRFQRLTYYDINTKTRVPSKTLKLFFNTTELPPRVLIGFKSHKTKLFVPKPTQCFKCQGFGHMQRECRNSVKCVRCGEDHKDRECKVKAKCANCNGDHPATSKDCPKKIQNEKIIKRVCKEKCSVKEARTHVLKESKQNPLQGKKEKLPKEHEKISLTKGLFQQLTEFDNFILLIIMTAIQVPTLSDNEQKVSVVADMVLELLGVHVNQEYILDKLTLIN